VSDSFDRLDFAISLSRTAGARALEAFRSIESLTVESKGHQDLVSNADRETEAFVRAEIARTYPDDGIVGEEEAPKPSRSGWTWVIDPIDGTANFVSGIPAWCVILACVHEGETQVGAICEPASGETFWAGRGKGAFVNGKKLAVSPAKSLAEGSVGTGFAARQGRGAIVAIIDDVIGQGGMFFRNASGGLMLAYTAAGRLIGYIEEDMNPWDCLAGLLMIEEAGGRILKPAPDRILTDRHRLIAGGPDVYDALAALADRHLPRA
jgi:Archaeal fructose-1,6-bisphosphatase and related enzymes of inositol monophosphatase family